MNKVRIIQIAHGRLRYGVALRRYLVSEFSFIGNDNWSRYNLHKSWELEITWLITN